MQKMKVNSSYASCSDEPYCTRSRLSTARSIEREIEIGKDLAIQEGKPEQMQKNCKGRLNKFLKKHIIKSGFIDNKKTVSVFKRK